MAYYDALVTAWNGATQPPTGVTGAALTGGMTTLQKITAINAWTVLGAAIPMLLPSYKIYNAIVPSEFQALTATQQQLIRDIISQGTVDGSASGNARAVMLQIFGVGTTTRTNLVNLAKLYDTPAVAWWSANGYLSPFVLADATNAGLT